MITPRGASVLGVGLALTISWIALGEIEMLAAGAGLLVAVVGALAITTLNRPRLEVARHLNPPLVNEGDRTAVEVTIRNRRRFPVFNLTVADGVGGLGAARFALGSLAGGEEAVASYWIVCRPRGVYRVGPTTVRVGDPLGLASAEYSWGETDQLIVYPAIEALSGYPVVRGRDPAQSASRPEHSQRGGEDFFTLRAYREGDDLRRVHWPSSAKLDDLMIRQMENPWQSRALIFFDVRSGSYPDAETFEKAVRGTASVARHLGAAGFAADMWLGRGLIDVAEHTSAMEALARVQPVEAVDIRAAASRLRHTGRGGALVMITGTPDNDLGGVERLLTAQHRATILLACGPGGDQILAALQSRGVKTVIATAGESWAAAWSHTIERTWAPVSAG
ncbi:MAG TPA: DUF58 domain-containing protein [Acidimicrobiia bacterium]|nr:DUF58 domain-containing protein [Acidimicrobiia bacterium]